MTAPIYTLGGRPAPEHDPAAYAFEQSSTDQPHPAGGPCAATPAKELRNQILNPCVPKNEREWWAAHTIEELLKDGGALLAAAERHIFGDECKAERDAFRATLAKAERS